MKIVIDIPKSVYNYIMLIGSMSTLDTQLVANAILDGIPLPKLPKEHKMREATSEELESVNNYIKSISKPTGVNFWDVD